MSRRVVAFLSAIALSASLGIMVSGTQATATKATRASDSVAEAQAAGRISILRPRGSTGADQPDAERPGRVSSGAVSQAAVPGYGIVYHGGPVVMGEKVVAIYWATAPIYTGGPNPATTPTGTGAADGSLIGHFLRNLSGSPYYNINTSYSNGAGNPIPNSISYTGFWANNTSVPTSCQNVSNTTIQTMIKNGFSAGKITYDPNTVYTVFTAGTVNLGGGFGNCPGTSFKYCAYHGSFTSPYGTVLFAAMPYNNAYPGSCTAFQSGGPANGDAGADAEVNTLVHELEEANTDPQVNVSSAWYDSSGAENADKCAWTFGTLNPDGKGNVTIGGRSFLVQQNWLNTAPSGSCAQSYGSVAITAPGAPTLNSATAGNAQVALAWSIPSSNGGASIDGYYVYRNGVKVSSLLTGTTFTNTGLTNGTSYAFTITAHNSVGESAVSNQLSATPVVTTVPGAPMLNPATAGNAQAVLTWSVPTSNGGATVDGYYVYRDGAKVSSLIPGTTFTNTGLVNGTAYSFTVTAHNALGEGAQSNARSATPSAGSTVPAAPTVSATTNPRSCFFGIFCSGGGVKVTWSVPAANGSAITQYRIYRSTTSTVNTAGSPYATSTGTSYTDSSTTKGTVYFYKVVAVNGVGPSPDSNLASAAAG